MHTQPHPESIVAEGSLLGLADLLRTQTTEVSPDCPLHNVWALYWPNHETPTSLASHILCCTWQTIPSPLLHLQAEPMDLGTLLHNINMRKYPTVAPFLADLALLPRAFEAYFPVEGRSRKDADVSLSILHGVCWRTCTSRLA